jgi:glycosyltransferase involved in cell wall biosynthesis
MNILFLTAYPPVLHMHGGGVLMFHNIRILSEKHSVRVISFIENDEEREMLRSLTGICESVTAVRRIPDFRPHWFSLLPFLVREFSTPEMYQAVENEFQRKRVDVVQCEYLQMAQFYRHGVLNILALPETLSANAYDDFLRATDPIEKVRAYYRWMAVLRYEVLMSRKFDRVVTMTERDAEYLRSYSANAHITAIPIGIDPDEFAPLPEDPTQPVEVVFLGNFRHTPNVEAGEFLVRRIAPLFPEIQFVIFGANVPEALRTGQNVHLRGYARDTRDLYRRPNTIVAAPLFSGTGQRVKLLEAFAMGAAVVTTSTGASGFPITNGVEAMIADNAADFSSRLRELLSSEDLRRQMGTKAHQMIQRHFSWQGLAPRLLELVERS